ncbi:MAG: hypothetical protein AABP62_29480 [Planctomycetota bacterium]
MSTNHSSEYQARCVSARLRFVTCLAAGMLQCSTMSFADSPQGNETASGKTVTPLPKLTPPEQQQFKLLKNKLVTPLNSKVNPGDRDTWFVLGFMDAAVVETRSREATPLGLTGVMWSDRRSKQQKVVKEAIIVQGRTAAALAVLQYVNSPNAAVAQLQSPSPAAREGWMKRQGTQVGANRLWVYQAYANEREARQFLENVRTAK